MHALGRSLTIAFTYIGTIVGAGFATGQEILQFFTLYGKLATFSILIASMLFLWLGTKIMLLAHRIRAKSYEDMNIYLFGEPFGRAISLFMLVLLLAISTVMLAGAGSLFREHLNLAYQTGLSATALLTYFTILKGMRGIKTVNAVVVPLMLLFMLTILVMTFQSPAHNSFLRIETDYPLWRVLLSPFMYAAFNLILAQAVLVPLGAAAEDVRSIRLGGLLGGIGITLMLFTGHIALSAHMPGIAQFDIPMGHVIRTLGPTMQVLFVILIFAEIFTTLIANAYGMILQLSQHVPVKQYMIAAVLMLFCFSISQFGFKTLLSTLYPFLGLISLGWLAALIYKP